MTGINSGLPLTSDVSTGGVVCPDSVPVRLENKQKNPNLSAIDYRGDIVVERYEVRYFRSDGRATQGVDVPFSISGAIAAEVIAGQDASLSVEVVRRQAKLEPPLINLTGNGGGQALIVTMFAEIALYGHTTIGQGVSAKGNFQIDFADFVGSATTCPTSN